MIEQFIINSAAVTALLFVWFNTPFSVYIGKLFPSKWFEGIDPIDLQFMDRSTMMGHLNRVGRCPYILTALMECPWCLGTHFSWLILWDSGMVTDPSMFVIVTLAQIGVAGCVFKILNKPT